MATRPEPGDRFPPVGWTGSRAVSSLPERRQGAPADGSGRARRAGSGREALPLGRPHAREHGLGGGRAPGPSRRPSRGAQPQAGPCLHLAVRALRSPLRSAAAIVAPRNRGVPAWWTLVHLLTRQPLDSIVDKGDGRHRPLGRRPLFQHHAQVIGMMVLLVALWLGVGLVGVATRGAWAEPAGRASGWWRSSRAGPPGCHRLKHASQGIERQVQQRVRFEAACVNR